MFFHYKYRPFGRVCCWWENKQRKTDVPGFPPTFGPTFVHMYGSTRDYSILDKHATLNTGLGEGVSYRARVLVAIRTEITENTEFMNSGVDVEPTYPISEVKVERNRKQPRLIYKQILCPMPFRLDVVSD